MATEVAVRDGIDGDAIAPLPVAAEERDCALRQNRHTQADVGRAGATV